jgi:16S rRNA (uracil1498-N3)-methyltransferase
VALFIGPEGGYEDAEVDQARAAGATVATLGPRILRTETAALAAVTLVLHALGEMV